MIIPTGTAQANLRFIGAAVPTGAEITLGLAVDTFGGTPVDAGFAVAAAWNGTSIDTYQTTTVELVEVMVKFGPTATGPSGVYATSGPGTGTNQSLGPAMSYLVQKNTNFGGRSGRGRFYIPGVPEQNADEGGELTSGVLGGLQIAMDAFYAALLAADLPPVLLHAEPDAPITTPLPITSFTVSSKIATQRRRLRR